MEPGSLTIFSQLRNYGRVVLKTANFIFSDHKKLANTQEQLKFNLRCKKTNVIPKSLRVRPPIRTPGGYRIAQRTSKHYLEELISNCHYRIGVYLRRIVANTNYVSTLIPENLTNQLKLEATTKLARIRNLKKQQLITKYNYLAQSAQDTTQVNDRWIINISNKQLTADEKRVLSKGLNFATVHSKNDKLKFIAAVEPIIDNLTTTTIDEKNVLRQRIITALNCAPKTNNITSGEQNALKALKGDDSILIVPADKGRSTVVINKDDYVNKVTEHLNDETTYREVASNPTNTLQNKVNTELKRLKDENSLSADEYKYLRSTTASTPLFYALIKTHKINYPIRPIVSFCDSPTYKLAQFLTKLLNPITNLGEVKLNNTKAAKSFLESVIIPEDFTLVSFDVKSLFTCIPQDYALQACEAAVTSYNRLAQDTGLSVNNIMQLTKLCLQSCTFQWNYRLFQQIKGCPMGSPISVVLAELTMQNFEETALSNPPHRPLFWKRYVDDVITALPSNHVITFWIT